MADDALDLTDAPEDDPTLRALKATRRDYIRFKRRSQRFLAVVVVGLLLDGVASVVSLVALVRVNDFAHANAEAVVAACERSNEEGQKHIDLWAGLIEAAPLEEPGPDATVEEVAAYAEETETRALFLADISKAFRPEDCTP